MSAARRALASRPLLAGLLASALALAVDYPVLRLLDGGGADDDGGAAAPADRLPASERPTVPGAPLKAMWGPVSLPDGSSAFGLYRGLGVQVLQMQLRWERVAAERRPAAPRDPQRRRGARIAAGGGQPPAALRGDGLLRPRRRQAGPGGHADGRGMQRPAQWRRTAQGMEILLPET